MNTFKACEYCKKKLGPAQFVHDIKSDDWICTNCGCVVKKYIYSDRAHTFAHTNSPAVTFSVSESTKHNTDNHQLLSRFFKKEDKEQKLRKKFEHFATLLDYPETVVNGAFAMINKFKELKQIRPFEMTVVACLIIAKRSKEEYVNTKLIESNLSMPGLGKRIISVCNTVGLSQRSDPLHYVPNYVQRLGFKYKYNKHVIRFYKRARKDNGSIGSDTLMALVLYRFFKANSKKSVFRNQLDDNIIEHIAEITHTSQSSLIGYIEGTGGKCTLFKQK